ncbi:MAG: hypothetical protein WBZ36_15250 [Candidatus Nitrosopolaris sp.]
MLVFALAIRLKPSIVANKLAVTFFGNNPLADRSIEGDDPG